MKFMLLFIAQADDQIDQQQQNKKAKPEDD